MAGLAPCAPVSAWTDSLSAHSNSPSGALHDFFGGTAFSAAIPAAASATFRLCLDTVDFPMPGIRAVSPSPTRTDPATPRTSPLPIPSTELAFSRFGVTYAPRYLCALLHEIGLSHQKARFISDKVGAEEHERKRREWAEVTWPSILRKAKVAGAAVLFIDEVSFAMWGSLARTWGIVGKQPTVKTKGTRRGLKMFGAMDLRAGRPCRMFTASSARDD